VNKVVSKIESWHKHLSSKSKYRLDLGLNYLLAFWILTIGASLTFYAGDISSEMFLNCAILALPSIPLRIVIKNYLERCRHEKLLDQMLSEVLHDPPSKSNNRTTPRDSDDNDDDWFMRIARGN